MKERAPLSRAALAAVLVAEAAVAVWLARLIRDHRAFPFDTDEALHANAGLELALDLGAGDLAAFVAHSYRQSFYPPAFSWVEALVFLGFGASSVSARLSSLGCLVGTAPVVYAIGAALDERRGWLVGSVATALLLTSVPILSLGALVMLEAPGLLASMVTLWAYLRGMATPSRWRWTTASFLLALTMLVKYPYGLITAATVGTAELVAVCEQPRRERLSSLGGRWLWLFGPFGGAMAVWFAGPGQIGGFLRYATAQPPTSPLLSVENLLFYPRALALDYAPTWIAGALIGAAAAWAATRWRDARLRVVLLYLGLGVLLLTVKTSNDIRFVSTVAPAAYLLTGAMMAWLCGLASRAPRRPALVVAAAGPFVVLAASVPALVGRLVELPAKLEVLYETDPALAEMAAWIATQTDGRPMLLLGPWDQFSAPAMSWALAMRREPGTFRFSDVRARSASLDSPPLSHPSGLERYLRSTRLPYVVTLAEGPERASELDEVAGTLSLRRLASRGFAYRHITSNALRMRREELERLRASDRYTRHAWATVYRVGG